MTPELDAISIDVEAVRDSQQQGLTLEEAVAKEFQRLSQIPEIRDALTKMESNLREGIPTQSDGVVVTGRDGIPMWHPAIDVRLKERIFLDGDIPELRSGPLPYGAVPAVPVRTTALDPVVVGHALEVASQEVGALLQIQDNESTELVLHERPSGVPGYQAGEIPALWSASEPMVILDPELRRRYAWRAISTTQGRRSLILPITGLVLDELRARGQDVVVHDVPIENANCKVWLLTAYGPEDIQDGFNFPATAGKTFTSSIPEHAKHICVQPHALIAHRAFGWMCWWWT
jgi:hypothetical protein